MEIPQKTCKSQNFPDAIPEEKRVLSSWVRCGHIPYENCDYIANDSGGPMDFINARRFLEAEYRKFMKDPDGYSNNPYNEENKGQYGNSHVGFPFWL